MEPTSPAFVGRFFTRVTWEALGFDRKKIIHLINLFYNTQNFLFHPLWADMICVLWISLFFHQKFICNCFTKGERDEFEACECWRILLHPLQVQIRAFNFNNLKCWLCFRCITFEYEEGQNTKWFFCVATICISLKIFWSQSWLKGSELLWDQSCIKSKLNCPCSCPVFSW